MSTDNRPTKEAQSWAYPLLLRLHFYLGLLVGPFVLIAAFTGAVYVISPQIENRLYHDQLYTQSEGEPVSLERQIHAAQTHTGDAAAIAAVRPAPEPGQTTRVMFTDTSLGQYQHRAIFIDPVNATVVGDLPVYGTSGALPFGTWTDNLHRSLHLGDLGRHYSELAASWLWIVALGGVGLWYARRRNRRADTIDDGSLSPGNPSARSRLSRRHSTLGLMLLLGLLFFSATGLTWSQWAGNNISEMRASLDWGTPSVNTTLSEAAAPASEGHHHGQAHSQSDHPPTKVDYGLFDAVLATARAAGIDAGKVEIKPPTAPGRAWTVTEIDRRWPTQVDATAIDPYSLRVVDQTNFQRFPLAAKLTRWGIDAHMGVLFGWPNQLILLFFALGLCTMVIWGYRMWWARRPTRLRQPAGPKLLGALRRAPPTALIGLVVTAALLGWFLPVMGASLLAILAIDLCLLRFQDRRTVREA